MYKAKINFYRYPKWHPQAGSINKQLRIIKIKNFLDKHEQKSTILLSNR